MMKAEKISENVTFTMNYADGETKEVKEGVLFEFNGNRITGHIGTSRKECLFAIAEALTETVVDLGLGEEFKRYIDGGIENIENGRF